MISSLSVRLMKIEHKSVSRRNQERKKNGRNFGTWKTKLLSLLGSNNSFGVTISLQPNSSKIGEKIVRIVKMSTKSNLHHHCQCQWKVSRTITTAFKWVNKGEFTQPHWNRPIFFIQQMSPSPLPSAFPSPSLCKCSWYMLRICIIFCVCVHIGKR